MAGSLHLSRSLAQMFGRCLLGVERVVRRSRIAACALVALTCLGITRESVAQSRCPTGADLPAGIVLTGSDEQIRTSVRRIDATTVRVDTLRDGKIVTSMVYRSGLFPLASSHPGGLTTYGYEPAEPRLVLRAGERVAYRLTARTPGRPDDRSQSEMTVGGTQEVSIGPCTYRATVIERTNAYGNGRSNIVLSLFSEELGLPILTRLRWSDGRQQDSVYSRIQALADP